MKKQVPLSIGIGNEELIHECFPEHSRIGTASKYDTDTEEQGKKRRVNLERSRATTKKINLGGLTVARAYTIPAMSLLTEVVDK